ncbi:unnamed protein product [Boreogadus saida]
MSSIEQEAPAVICEEGPKSILLGNSAPQRMFSKRAVFATDSDCYTWLTTLWRGTLQGDKTFFSTINFIRSVCYIVSLKENSEILLLQGISLSSLHLNSPPTKSFR